MKFKWPWVSRKTLEREQNAHRLDVAFERGRADRELKDRADMLDSLLPKLFKVTASRPLEPFGRFRVQVDFTDDFVYQCFVHGDSQEAIRYLAQRLSYQIERDIATMNFARLKPYQDAMGR